MSKVLNISKFLRVRDVSVSTLEPLVMEPLALEPRALEPLGGIEEGREVDEPTEWIKFTPYIVPPDLIVHILE